MYTILINNILFMRIDVHQHIWTSPLLEALATRTTLPFVRRQRGLTVLHSAGDKPYLIQADTEAPQRRAQLVHADGLDRAIVALSSPIGVEALERAAAQELIEAHLEGVEALPSEFAVWGPIALEGSGPDDVDVLLERGCVGVSLPATALAGPAALVDAAPLLERAAARDAPVFVHPGVEPGYGAREASLTEPLWWPALTSYVAQMQAAWLSFAALGRREHPELRIVFAMLAGGAPLLHERLVARGGPALELRDPLTYYDTSSYGLTAIEAIARTVGAEQLVYGSDRPVVEPTRTGREQLLQANAAQLFGPTASLA